MSGFAVVIDPLAVDQAVEQIESELSRLEVNTPQLERSISYIKTNAKKCGGGRKKYTKKIKKLLKKHKKTRKH
jgi:hypothetical protein